MKARTVTRQQSAYTRTRPLSHERQIEVQQQAAELALRKGDLDEWQRCRSRADQLGQRTITPDRSIELPTWIVRGALGKRDSIVRMFEAGHLTLHQVSAAMDLRAYAQGDAVAAAGLSGGLSEFVDGGVLNGMEAHIDRMRPGYEAKQRMKDTLREPLFPAVWSVIIYGKSLTNASRCLKLRKANGLTILRTAVQESLTDVAGYFGARAEEAA